MEDGPPKPDPFPVRRAASLMGVEPKDTALVGAAASKLDLLIPSRGVVLSAGPDLQSTQICQSLG